MNAIVSLDIIELFAETERLGSGMGKIYIQCKS